MKEAMLYTKVRDKVRCDLCARRCVINEGEAGFCRVRYVKNGALYSKVYGLIDGMAADPVEKKPLFHFAPGSHTFSISTSSCNFRCAFCLNYHSSQRTTPVGEEFTPSQLVELAKKHECQGMTYTYTEPTIFMELAYDTAKIANKEGMYNTFVTNGYMTVEAVDLIAPYLDAASVNFKGSGNKDFYMNLMEVSKTEPIFNSMERMKEKGVFIEITNLIIPEVGDFEEDTRHLVQWVIDNLGPKTPFHFTSFAPTYKMTNLPRTPTATIEKHVKIAKSLGLEYVYSGNIPGHDYENTYCPKCNFKAVERYSVYLKSNNLSPEGTCPRCGADLGIAGISWMRLGKGKSRFSWG